MNFDLIKERIKVFIAFHSTQVIAGFASLGALWAAMPDSMKTDIYSSVPFLQKIVPWVYIVSFVIAFYKARMNTQLVPRTDIMLKVAQDAPDVTPAEKTAVDVAAPAPPKSLGG